MSHPSTAGLPDPFNSWELPPPAVAERRTLPLLGARVELVLLPDRLARRVPRAPLLRADHAPRIVETEALWRCAEPPAALTPNRYPFAAGSSILWSLRAGREASPELLALAMELAERHGGSVLMNTQGAAATQPRAHLHLVREAGVFLPALATAPLPPDVLGVEFDDVEVVRLAPPFPGLVLGLRGGRGARARAAARVLALRSAPAVNLVSDGTTTWIAPRRVETPAPHFPSPLGCSELWGRFCFEDAAAYAAATAEGLLAAFAAALCPPLPA